VKTPSIARVTLLDAFRSKRAVFSARLLVTIPNVNNGHEHCDTNVKISADTTKQSSPSLHIAGIFDNAL
jgi:hypothetical protein